MDSLAALRLQLNTLDGEIVRLLGERFRVCREVGNYKRQNGIPMMQSARVAEVKERCARLAADNDVDPQFVRHLFGLIIDEACRLEDDIIGEANGARGVG
jgi:4-amino-4-deoxychorismate mutase